MSSFDADISDDIIRLEQARMLNAGSRKSAFLVMLIIVNATALIALSGQWQLAIAWFAIASSLVMVTRLYATYRMPDGITLERARDYINGHIAITATTGLTWSTFAILATDLSSELDILVSSVFLVSIALGGLLPGTAHRGDYIVMVSCVLLPFPIWLMVQTTGLMRYYAIGYFVLFLVFVLGNQKVHAQTIQAIKAKFTEERHQAASSLMISVGHDLAQPLLAQRNFLEVLTRSDVDEKHKDIISKLVETQASQEYLLNSLMGYEKLKHGLTSICVEDVDVTQSITDIVDEFAAIAAKKNIETRLELRALRAQTDSEIVKRCLRNILSNAYNYTSDNGTVSVSLQRKDIFGVIEISDTGCGIPEDQLEHVLKPFVRSSISSDTMGLGLGLATTKRGLELLGGSLHISSVVDVGTQVTIRVPMGD